MVENSPEIDICPESEMEEDSNPSIFNSNPAQQDEDTEENEDVLYPNNDFCFTEDDFLEAQINMNEATRHTGTYNLAWSKIKALEGDIVECRNQDSVVNWKIVSNVEEDVFADRREAETKRMKDVFCPIKYEGIENTEDASELFWSLWPKTVDEDLQALNKVIERQNAANRKTYRRQWKKVSKCEFFIFHALLIGASVLPQQGEKLWTEEDRKTKNKRGMIIKVDFGKWMKAWRFRQIKTLIPKIMESEVLKQRKDDWWKFKQRVSDFNKIRKEKLYASYALVFDESMSAYTPR